MQEEFKRLRWCKPKGAHNNLIKSGLVLLIVFIVAAILTPIFTAIYLNNSIKEFTDDIPMGFIVGYSIAMVLLVGIEIFLAITIFRKIYGYLKVDEYMNEYFFNAQDMISNKKYFNTKLEYSAYPAADSYWIKILGMLLLTDIGISIVDIFTIDKSLKLFQLLGIGSSIILFIWFYKARSYISFNDERNGFLKALTEKLNKMDSPNQLENAFPDYGRNFFTSFKKASLYSIIAHAILLVGFILAFIFARNLNIDEDNTMLYLLLTTNGLASIAWMVAFYLAYRYFDYEEDIMIGLSSGVKIINETSKQILAYKEDKLKEANLTE